MQGYQLTFFTHQNRQHRHMPLAEWLLRAARDLGIGGATIIAAAEGYGHHRRIHSARFFEIGDQPQEILMAVTEDEARRLFDLLRSEGVHLVYVKIPVEFGVLGEPGE